MGKKKPLHSHDFLWCYKFPGKTWLLLDFNQLNFQAPYLPYVLTGFSLALGSPVLVDVLGIVCGHLYYYLEDVFPNVEGGFKILHTPQFLKTLVDPAPLTEETRPNEQGEGPGGFDWGDEE